MSYWNQKNTFCYNSRLTEYEFKCIASDYSRGISASQSSIEFKEHLNKSISRQTISKYFDRIAYVLLCERETYPWWSVDHWGEITDEQFEDIRKAVYGEDKILPRLRNELRDITGQPITVDNELYIQILRDMSVTQNGLKPDFISSLARACELAWFFLQVDECTMGFAQTLLYNQILNLFKNGRAFIFKRKESPRTRAIDEKYYDDDNSDARIYAHMNAMRDYKASQDYKKKSEWLDSLTETDKVDLEKKQRLSVFTGKIKLPPERNY